MDKLCLFLLVSFLQTSVYCSVENRTDKFLEKSFTPGDVIQVQNLFVASCEKFKEDLNSVRNSLTVQNEQMQCMVSSIEEVYNITHETKGNVIKQNTVVKYLVDSVALLNLRFIAQEDQSQTIVELLKARGEKLQALTTLMTEFCSKKKEESEITVTSCPEDFEEFKGKCYRFHEDSKTWSDASEYCQKSDGFLAEPKSKLENDFIRDLAFRSKKRLYAIWLGGTDKSKEGEWRWESNDDIISGFTNWYDGGEEDKEPRNTDGDEDCLATITVYDAADYYGRWFADLCHRKYTFVCQNAKVATLKNTTKA